MTPFINRCVSRRLLAAAATALLLATPPVLAGPGAHGPNGEHLDGPTPMRAASALPRVEAHTEGFELVAELRPSELSVMVDRYETNEPLLGARLEVESGSMKAVASFRAEQGDYVVTDAAMLKALAAPGEHGLVFTLLAGQDSDLLDATLVIAPGGGRAAAAGSGRRHAQGDADHAHDHELERAVWVGAGVAALGLISSIAWWRRRRRDSSTLQGGLR